VARPEGLEPPATRLEGECSIHLSYGRAYRILWLRAGEVAAGSALDMARWPTRMIPTPGKCCFRTAEKGFLATLGAPILPVTPEPDYQPEPRVWRLMRGIDDVFVGARR
jgi:hypothetical protein